MISMLQLFVLHMVVVSSAMSSILEHHHSAILHDTGMMRDGELATAYVAKQEHTRRFYFAAGADKDVNIRVTPCGSDVIVNITSHKDDTSDDPTLRAEHVTSGTGPTVYSTLTTEPTLYHIAVTTSRTVTLQLFAASSRLSVQKTFPQVPQDGATVTVRKSSKRSMRLSWTPVLHPASGVLYCVALSDTAPYPSDCAAKALILGYSGPPLPKYTGFGFLRNQQRRREIKRYRNSLRNKSPKHAQYRCTKSTSIVFRQLQPKTRYYISVSAVQQRTNASTQYPPVSAVTRPKRADVLTLNKSKRLHFTDSATQNLKLKLKRNPSEITWFFDPCRAIFKVKISCGSPLAYPPNEITLRTRDTFTMSAPENPCRVEVTPEQNMTNGSVGILASTSTTNNDRHFKPINSC